MSDEHDNNDEQEQPIYDVDEETRLLIETACNCIMALSEAQIQEESKIGLMAIADELTERFALDAVELEEHHHSTDEGEEIVLAPKGGVFPDSDDDEDTSTH